MFRATDHLIGANESRSGNEQARLQSLSLALGFLLLTAVLLPGSVWAQSGEQDWDVTQPRGETQTVSFTTTEGTWLSVDVSPDGTTLAFDMLGEIWLLPIAGGQARPITRGSGIALDFHPEFSPDGSKIAFISDRSGQSNVWVMNADGSNPRQVSDQSKYRIFLPTWSPNGEYILARVGGSSNGRGRGELRMWHVDGGDGTSLTGDDTNATWGDIGPSGRYVYYTERVSVGFNLPDAARGLHQIRRLDRKTGRELPITSGTEGPWDGGGGRRSSGGAVAPQVSPDGKWIAFGRRIASGNYQDLRGHEYGPRTALWVRNLSSGEERVVMDPITPDAQERNNSGALPRYSWTPDGESIVITEGGHLWRVDVSSGERQQIPFEAHVKETISEQVMNPIRVPDDSVDVRMMRWHSGSPDGRQVAFSAVGRIWVSSVSNGAPRTVTPDTLSAMEFSPAWSPDGRWLAFTTWSDEEGGFLWKIRPDGSQLTRLTNEAGMYLNSEWSPDGSEILVARGSGQMLRGRMPSDERWFTIEAVDPVDGDKRSVTVARNAQDGHVIAPTYGPDGRIFFLTNEGEDSFYLESVTPDGVDRQVHIKLAHSDEAVPSPDGQRVAFQRGDNLYVAPLPYPGTAGDTVAITEDESPVDVTRLSYEGGNFPHWVDENTLEWGSADTYFRHDFERDVRDTVEIDLSVPRRRPEGALALTNARVIPMDGSGAMRSADILVRDGRIAAIGRSGSVTIPEGVRTMDLSGKTVVPGYIDVHLHVAREGRGVIPERSWEMAANLAYGVTTLLDPSAWGETIFSQAENSAAGVQVGPRIYSTGSALSRDVSTRHGELHDYEDAAQEVARYKSYGTRTIKEYMQRRRDQRQWVVEAARDAGLNVTSEGDTDHLETLSLVMDGHTGFEHPILNIPLYRDVTEFLGQAGTYYSPTLVVGGTGPWGEGWFYQKYDMWKWDKLRRFTPWRWLEPHTRRRLKVPEHSYPIAPHAQGVADVIEAGGYGTIGAHGQQQGFASHMEMRLYATAASPKTVLKMSTIWPAQMIGIERDVGTLTEGKLADLVVLNSNPLQDIKNASDIQYVMKAGILYHDETLSEIWPKEKEFGDFYWRQPFARPEWSPENED